MLPKEIINILQNYQSEVSEEISNINLAIDRIKDGLNTVNSVLIDEFSAFAKNKVDLVCNNCGKIVKPK